MPTLLNNKISFDLKITPMPHQSVRTGKGRFYVPAEVLKYKRDVQAIVRSQMGKAGMVIKKHAPLKVKIIYIFTYTQKLHRTDGILIPKVTKPDVTDNLNKALCDALEGVVYTQDQQIYDFNGIKFWGPTDRILITVTCVEV